jgi:outer membrane protein assembly factor BamA
LFFEGKKEYSKKLLGSETDFNRTTFETRGFCPIFPESEHHVLALRLFMDYKNGDVPFYHLPDLGGIFFNRGLIEGRFRDDLSLKGNLEYRLKIYNRLHWAFFLDAGNVWHEFRDLTFRHTKTTGGTGMRYYVPPGNLLLARVDGGFSSEGFQIYLTFDQPF